MTHSALLIDYRTGGNSIFQLLEYRLMSMLLKSCYTHIVRMRNKELLKYLKPPVK